jgi:hypothetical protein
MRVAEGAFRTKTDKNGQEFYLHRLAGAAASATPAPPLPTGAACERADADTLHTVYSALLAALQLSDPHRDNLRRRGLTDDQMDRRGYRTLPVRGRAALARKLRERFGDKLFSVPGFVVKQGDRGPYVTLAGAAGLLVPIRDTAGHVVALLVRRDDTKDGGGKYRYISSAAHGGPGPGAPAHVPLGVAGPVEVVRLTEGALKSDIATALSGVPTIGASGLAWRPLLDVLRELGAKTVRLALDMDARDKPTVGRALTALADALVAAGLAVELEQWPAEHKGIDDALAAGADALALSGDAARQAIADTLAEATAAEPLPEPEPLGRLADVLAQGGIEALFRDRKLLQALAALAECDPAEFACRRAQLQRCGVKLRDLDKVLAPLRHELRRQKPPPDVAGCYRISAGRIVRDVLTKDGAVEVPLANWAGRIVEEIVHDDGAERRITFAVEGALVDGTPLPRTEVAADAFPWMRWPVEAWGTRAVVLAGASTADHLRVALQLLSGDVLRRTVYGHVGWCQIGGEWVYLHAGGAIGKDGSAAGVAVSLPDALVGFALPDPPGGAVLAEAIQASLRTLDSLAPDRIAFPLFAALYRAPLAAADFALHLCGATGNFKTELAALEQQHYGAAMDARNLPASWSSTGNALEGVAFAVKDAVLVVDDFAPSGSAADVQRCHREADRLLRAQGNRSGRARCRVDGTVRPTRAPRGIIVSTGEDVPRGQSLRARLLTLEVSPGDVNVDRLTACQAEAAAGKYALALAGFVRWLAPRQEALGGRLRQEAAGLRDKARAEGQHARTPGVVADLALGMKYFLDFAVEAGAISVAERDDLARRCWAALGKAAAAQAKHVEAAEPSGHFLRLLAGALASGRCHVAGPDGAAPAAPAAWGWREVEIGTGQFPKKQWQSQGRRVGWVDGSDLFLEPEAAYAEAQRLAGEQGDSLTVSASTLRRRLNEHGLLASTDAAREVLTIRRTLEGRRREVIHLQAASLLRREPDQPDQLKENTGKNGQVAGRVCPNPTTNPTSNPTSNLTNPTNPTSNPTSEFGQKTGENAQLVGLVGLDAGKEGEAEEKPATASSDEWGEV